MIEKGFAENKSKKPKCSQNSTTMKVDRNSRPTKKKAAVSEVHGATNRFFSAE